MLQLSRLASGSAQFNTSHSIQPSQPWILAALARAGLGAFGLGLRLTNAELKRRDLAK